MRRPFLANSSDGEVRSHRENGRPNSSALAKNPKFRVRLMIDIPVGCRYFRIEQDGN
jgi:hypothetical protein